MFGYYADDSERFSVVGFGEIYSAVSIEEKAECPKSGYVVAGPCFQSSCVCVLAKRAMRLIGSRAILVAIVAML